MQPDERFGLRLWLGLVVGALWSLVPALFLHDNLLACFAAGIPTGMLLTWIFTRTSLEHPVIFGTLSLPISTWLYFLLFSFARQLIAGVGGAEPLMYPLNPLAESLWLTVMVFITPLVVFPWLTSIASTCLVSAVFAKRPPRRSDLLPER